MCAAVLAGTSLSVAGLALQTVFCNPLAGPFVLGISSGASLGVRSRCWPVSVLATLVCWARLLSALRP
jgi:ABC-type Fe3+-siderophore transport system, permease component